MINFSKHGDDLINELKRIKDLGFVKATRTGNTAIGKTLEDLLLKEEDNLSLPDFEDIEIKSRDSAGNALVTLFTKAPSYPRGANTILRTNYGYEREGAMHNVLYMTASSSSIASNQYMNVGFKVRVDRNEEKVYLDVYSIDDQTTPINSDTFWTFDVLEDSLNKKLKYLCLVQADRKIINGEVYFNYTDIDFYSGLTFDNFINALENGDIYIDTRIGVYPDGRSHDRGTGFRIRYENLLNYSVKHTI